MPVSGKNDGVGEGTAATLAPLRVAVAVRERDEVERAMMAMIPGEITRLLRGPMESRDRYAVADLVMILVQGRTG